MMKSARNAGFTLVEAIVVIVIVAIISGVVAVFISGPVQSYFQSARRAEMTDAADTALRRMARDLHLALPNSVRVTQDGGVFYLEFIHTVSGGRYRQNDDCFTTGLGCNQITALTATNPATLPSLASADALLLTIYNLNNNTAADCADDAPSVYCGQNSAVITSSGISVAEITLDFASTTFMPARGISTPGQRFQLADGPVTYVCAPVAGGGGTLTRHAGYALTVAQPTVFNDAGDLLANDVSDCLFNYDDGILGNQGLVTLWLELQRDQEPVRLMQQVHVDNTP